MKKKFSFSLFPVLFVLMFMLTACFREGAMKMETRTIMQEALKD